MCRKVSLLIYDSCSFFNLNKLFGRVGRSYFPLLVDATVGGRSASCNLPFCRCHHVFVGNRAPRWNRDKSHGNSSQEKHEAVIHPVVRGRRNGPREHGRRAGRAEEAPETFCHVEQASHLPAHVRANHAGRRHCQRKVDLQEYRSGCRGNRNVSGGGLRGGCKYGVVRTSSRADGAIGITGHYDKIVGRMLR